MRLKLDSSRPVYQQIMAHIRETVLSNRYPPGSRIPSVRDLAAEMNVNPNTIQRAMAELEQEGLLISNGTLGKTVTDDRSIIAQLREKAVHDTVTECSKMFHALGLTMQEAATLLLNEKED